MTRHRLSVLVPTLIGLAATGFSAEQPAPIPKPKPADTAPVTAGERVTATAEQEAAGSFTAETVQSTKLEMPIEETPQSITVIPRALMESQGSFSLRDAVRNAPGLTIASGEGGVTGDAFTIRGFAATNDIYVDGMKDNGLYNRDTFNLEQVEILKGSSALLFGRGSVGGAINQVTRKPTDEWTANAAVTAGTDSLLRGSVGFGGPVVEDLLGVRLDAYVHDADSFRDEIHVNRKGVAPAVRIKIDERSSLTVQSMHQRETSDLDYGLVRWKGRPADVDVNTFYGFKDDDEQTYDTDIYTVAFDHRFNDHLKFRNATRYAEYARHYQTNIPSGAASTAIAPTATTTGVIYHTDPSLDTTSISQALRASTQQTVYNQTDVSSTGEIANHEVSFLGGMELGRESYDFKNRTSVSVGGVRRVSIFNPDQADSWGAGRAENLDEFSSHTENDGTTVAFYGMGTIEIIEKLKVVLGIRWDQYDSESIANSGVTLNNTTGLPLATAPAVTEYSRRDRMWSPRVGLIYEVVEDTTIYASYGTSFSPSAEGINSSLDAATSDLGPEKTRTIEVGSKVDLLEDRLLISAAIFRVEKFNARTVDAVTTLPELDGNQRTDGFELGAAGTITRNWRLFAGGSYLNARYFEDDRANPSYTDYGSPTVRPGGIITYASKNDKQIEGKRITGVPQVSGTIWTTYDVLGSGFEIGGGVTKVGQRYTNTVNTESIPGYARVDATVGYGFKAAQVDWSAQLNVFNLFDTRYIESSHPNNFATPGTSRAGQLTVAADF